MRGLAPVSDPDVRWLRHYNPRVENSREPPDFARPDKFLTFTPARKPETGTEQNSGRYHRDYDSRSENRHAQESRSGPAEDEPRRVHAAAEQEHGAHQRQHDREPVH